LVAPNDEGSSTTGKRSHLPSAEMTVIGKAEELESMLEKGKGGNQSGPGNTTPTRRGKREQEQDLAKAIADDNKAAHPFVILLLCGHALSASLLLVVNKWALQALPYVWVLTTMQFVPAVVMVGLAGFLGLVELEMLRMRKLMAFFPAAGMFFITMTAGNAVVKHSNVDTFIVMRALVPIPAALLETIALGEPWPRPQSWAGLATLVFGSMCFANANRGIAIQSASWVCLFLVMMPVDAVLIKHLINTTGLPPWGLVLYQNFIAGSLGLVCTFVFELNSAAARADFAERLTVGGRGVWLPVVLSCFLGISVSFFQMKVRRIVSSTAFMVLGVSNKFLALLINQLTMATNSSFVSIASVLISISGAVCFQQTVKGKGISQAPVPMSEAGGPDPKAYFAMLAGLVWAGVLNMNENMP